MMGHLTPRYERNLSVHDAQVTSERSLIVTNEKEAPGRFAESPSPFFSSCSVSIAPAQCRNLRCTTEIVQNFLAKVFTCNYKEKCRRPSMFCRYRRPAASRRSTSAFKLITGCLSNGLKMLTDSQRTEHVR